LCLQPTFAVENITKSMAHFVILFFIVTALLIAITIVVLCKHFRKLIKTKEQAIVHHIHEQDKLKDELKYFNVEKKVMEKMLKKELEAVIFWEKKRD